MVSYSYNEHTEEDCVMELKKRELTPKVQILDETGMKRALMRLSYEIVERCTDPQNIILIGIRTRGVPMAERLRDNIRKNSGVDIPVGALDITFYRDDLEKIADAPQVREPSFPFSLTGHDVVLVDDVLFTGRTARAALDAVLEAGRPRRICLAVLVDRGHRELPIRPDFVGKNVPTSMSELIRVNLPETDGKMNVELCDL